VVDFLADAAVAFGVDGLATFAAADRRDAAADRRAAAWSVFLLFTDFVDFVDCSRLLMFLDCCLC
jgi:hypothetical protein